MDSLKEQILEKLEHLPEPALQEVLDFVDFLEWRKVAHKEPVELQQGEIEANCPVEYVGGVLVVQSYQDAKNLETAVHDLREEQFLFFAKQLTDGLHF
jgi:Protein of unknown function (DUF2281)